MALLHLQCFLSGLCLCVLVVSVGGNALQVTRVMQSDYFFQVTSKITHYFLIYKKISEFFKEVTPVTLFSHLLTGSSRVAMLREIRSKCRALCVNILL